MKIGIPGTLFSAYHRAYWYHLLPFGCMPELVTQTIIPALARNLDFPILFLSLDEQTG